jgi:hypothetical protein
MIPATEGSNQKGEQPTLRWPASKLGLPTTLTSPSPRNLQSFVEASE